MFQHRQHLHLTMTKVTSEDGRIGNKAIRKGKEINLCLWRSALIQNEFHRFCSEYHGIYFGGKSWRKFNICGRSWLFLCHHSSKYIERWDYSHSRFLSLLMFQNLPHWEPSGVRQRWDHACLSPLVWPASRHLSSCIVQQSRTLPYPQFVSSQRMTYSAY